MTDEQLLVLASRGDAAAFARLYDRHAAVAFGAAVRLCRDQGDAEAAVQEAFLALWRAAGEYGERRGGVRVSVLALVMRAAYRSENVASTASTTCGSCG